MSTPETNDTTARLREAVVALNKMRGKLESAEREKAEPIAIVGMGCRFPGGATGAAGFWRLLRDGVDAMSEVPKDRWDLDAWYDANPDAPGKMYVREGGFVEQVDRFDAGFFGITPREAAAMDPQQRLLLEVAWEALENAGQVPTRLANSPTGVFVGVMGNDYSRLQMRMDDPARIDPYTGTGYAWSFLAGRLSFLLGLQGPSMVVDTACSSSLVAVHLAVRSLRSGECNLAIAAGVSLILAPESNVIMCQLKALAKDGRCKTFDASADGYGRGEGCGVVVLKRLSDALASGDEILAVIRGTATNHDGPSGGLTIPNGAAQQDVIRRALANGRVAPHQVSYLEAHGTGTSLGDPIELRAMWAVLGQGRPAERRLTVGSVKTNFGHLEGAAGISGLIKLALALRHKQIPAHLHLKNPNPYIDWDRMPIDIPRQLAAWDVPSGESRIGGVSSFGLSGINAHVVLEEAPERKEPVRAQVAREVVLPLSARSEEALKALAGEYVKALEEQGAPGVEEAGYTAAVRRAHHEQRLAVVGASREEWTEKLRAWMRGEERPGLAVGKVEEGRRGKVVFVFPGQGSQWEGMGRELMGKEPVFRQAIEACDAALKRHVKWSLKEVLEKGQGLEKVEVIQPALFAVEVALAAMWRSWGVEPDAVVGHSMGEVAAAHVAGALSLEDAARVICERSRLVASTSGKGGMAVVELGAEEAEKRIASKGGRVSVAASNGPRSTVLAGEKEALGEVLKELEGEGKFCRWVKVDYASHSAQMEPLKPELMRVLGSVRPKAGNVPIYSTVTVTSGDGADFDASYWVKNLRERVRFAETVKKLKEEGHGLFVEMSPHPILKNEVEGSAEGGVIALPSLRRGEPERAALLGSLGALYAAGHEVDWTKQHPQGGRLVALPTYPWQRQRHWLEGLDAGGNRSARNRATSRHPMLGDSLHASVGPGTRFWEIDLGLERLPFLADHRVQEAIILPAAAYLEMATSAAIEGFGAESPRVEDVRFSRALFLPDEGTRRVQLALTPEPGGRVSFQVSSASPDEHTWTLHASGSLRLEAAPSKDTATLDEAQVRARCSQQVSGARHYEDSRARGLDYGPGFQGVESLWRRDGEALGRIQLPAPVAPAAGAYRIHPALLDACFQVVTAAVPADAMDQDETYLPVGMESFRILAPPKGSLWSHATLRRAEDGNGFVGDVLIHDAEGQLVGEVHGIRAQKLDATKSGDSLEDWLYEVRWVPRARPVRTERPAEAGRSSWLVLADESGVGSWLVTRLQARGERVVLVTASSGAAGLVLESPERYKIDPRRPESFRQLIAEAFGAKPPVGVVHLWSLDVASPGLDSAAWLREAEMLNPTSVLHLSQALAGAGWSKAPRLWLVTRGSQPVGSRPVLPGGSSMWGMARSLELESPEWRCTAVDLDTEGEISTQAASLLDELDADDTETQVALRGTERSVARLVRASAPRSDAAGARVAAAGRPYRLEISQPGLLENLTLREIVRRAPGAGEVEIEVRAAGLNFLDVLSALGMRPDVEPDGVVKPGGECSGVVVAVGEGVTEVRPGDAVIALAPFSFSTHVTTSATFVALKPPHLSFEEAAGIPITFMTAHYALNHVGRLQRGERVLIHSASGGTGLAAVALARLAGAEIFATAGSEEKRAYLRFLGIHHVMDSRSLAFAEEIRGLTGGEGVDVVLNSLSGEAVSTSLSVLAPYGRFLEIGKRDIYEDRRLGLAPFQRNLTYSAIDLARMLRERPALAGSLLRQVVALFADRTLSSPPVRAFPLSHAEEAFHHMAQARHIGKIVLCPDVSPEVRIAPLAGAVRPDGTYLITGGLGGIGLVLARWLVEQGARHIVLLGRGRPTSQQAQETLARLSAAGARVVVASADVTQPESLAVLLADISRSGPPLRGIFHGAAVLDDGIMLQLDRERLHRVMAPKVEGAWNLHTLTSGQPLDFFVLFSSAASVLGAQAQSNYAAANAFLDVLAWHRRTRGLPAQSINWGPWSEVGLAAARPERGARLESYGLSSISPTQGLEILERLLREDREQVVVLSLNVARLRRSPQVIMSRPLLVELLAGEGEAGGVRLDAAAILRTLRSVPPPERRSLLESHLQEQVARTLRMAPEKLSLIQALNRMGLDSLMAMELKKRVEASLGVSLPVVRFLKGPSISELAGELLEHIATGDALEAVLVPTAATPAADDGEWEIVRL
ncbi:type I polyketide synthase [Archangium violaceum]|uniref:type I polyketide synthase n=1 Tax=Archangium violaceum TaxID=83451 RepID=UPI00193B5089|nr:type I polyketide synthase [Archangium violaceum]QRK05992.1 type I polyketide synthase [Archangium violaceum]